MPQSNGNLNLSWNSVKCLLLVPYRGFQEIGKERILSCAPVLKDSPKFTNSWQKIDQIRKAGDRTHAAQQQWGDGKGNKYQLNMVVCWALCWILYVFLEKQRQSIDDCPYLTAEEAKATVHSR